jgi:hypothetical protein
MAHTRLHPHDYNKRIVLIDHLKRLCNQCGGFCAPDHDNGGFFCMSCKSTDVAEVMESKVDDFRARLESREYEKAVELAADCAPQMDEFLDMLGAAMNQDGEL